MGCSERLKNIIGLLSPSDRVVRWRVGQRVDIFMADMKIFLIVLILITILRTSTGKSIV